MRCLDFCGDEVLIGHNLPFDYGFVRNQAKLFGLSFEKQGIDTLKIARSVHKGRQSNSLEALCTRYSIVNSSAHRAYHDALATAKLYQTLAHYYENFQPQLFQPTALSVWTGSCRRGGCSGHAEADRLHFPAGCAKKCDRDLGCEKAHQKSGLRPD